jgi:predicted ATPase/DNA-binding SARP family transcriptional activator/DNA-binding CsgD family transcriptional regulator
MLGGFRVAVKSRWIAERAWRRRKAGNVVKLLALAAGHRLHREQLMELLWPNLSPQAAMNNLHHTLHDARQVLEPDRPPSAPSSYLQFQHDTLSLTASEGIWVDVEAFEHACALASRGHDPGLYEAAIALYKGDLLPQDLYEDWTIRRREELRGRILSLQLEQARLYGSRAEYRLAIDALKSVIMLEPTHEEAQALLMRAYALAGQRRQALDQYTQLSDALRRELDAEPDVEIQELEQDIRAGRHISGQGFSDQDSDARQRVDPVAASQIERAIVLPNHNLPSQLTSFIGRDVEIAEVAALFAGDRLVTLTGTGGCGKTRLALEIAGRMLHRYPDGVWLVELATLSDARLVPQAVAQVLDVREEAGRTLPETLIDYLRDRQLFLVLNNCEHLLDACSRLVETLLHACPNLRILATSRQALGVAGEVIWLVPPLAAPASQDLLSVDRLPHYDAIRLFMERARSHRPGFALTAENAPWITRICRRLDGIPLAIEMAAVRVKLLPVARIAARLDESLDLLAAGHRTALPRQQTLRATLDWSYALLTRSEQIAFRRLSVFVGGWSLEAAEQVCVDETIAPHSMLGLLEQMYDKSLISAEEHGDEVRYRLLEPVRQYALEHLAEANEAEALRRRHALYYLALAEAAEPELIGPRQTIWLLRLEAEHDNLRAALAWMFAHEPSPDSERGELGLHLSGALWRFWYIHGHLSEGRRWLETALASDSGVTAEPHAVRAGALKGAGVLTYMQGDHTAAIALYEESLALYRALSDQPGIVALLNNLGMVAHYQGDYAHAMTRYSEALDLTRKLSDKRLIAVTLDQLGSLAKDMGEYERATLLGEESLSLFRATGDRQSAAAVLGNLANLACLRGDYERAAVLSQESLEQFRDLGDKLNVAGALQNLGTVAYSQGQDERAAALFEEALALSREVGDQWGVAGSLNSLSRLASQANAYERAAAQAVESLLLHQELRYAQGIAASLMLLGGAAWGMGDAEQALQHYRESLTSYQALNDQLGLAECIERLAAVIATARPQTVARLLGAAVGLRETHGVVRPPSEQTMYERVAAAVRDVLGRKGFLAACESGRAAPIAEIVNEALSLCASADDAAPQDPAADGQPVVLTPREQQIARLIAHGLTNRQIGAELGMAGRTVDTHVGRILKKLGVHVRLEVASWVQRNLD